VGRITLDGRLDEGEWLLATPFCSFVRIAPTSGGKPGTSTEVRLLRGKDTLFVGVRCFDPAPGGIVRPLGRRDHPARSDAVTVIVDADGDGRTATLFALTAGNVQSDALVYDDDRISYDWDAVWDGATAVDGEGWTAELAIPYAALGAAGGAGLVRIGILRDVARTHERSATFLVPRDARGLASRLNPLEGLGDLAPPPVFSVAPYLAARGVARPQYSDPARPTPRLVDATGDVGVDLRARLGALTLAGAVNPDFGQVEADQVVQNLSTFETFFREKRPFFTEGFEVFEPVGTGNESVPQRVFYSRRIGLAAPILAAAKVVGSPADDVRAGLLDAVVSGGGQPAGSTEDAPRRGLRWTAAQPLRFAPGDAYPLTAPAPENRLAAVARWRLTRGLSLGAQGTSARAVAPTCTAADLARDPPPASCAAVGGEVLAADVDAVSSDAAWYAYGQAAASRAGGGPPERVLRDGTVLRRGDLGRGGYVRAGKRGGEPLRFDLGWSWAAPELDLNASGFQRTQNEQEAKAKLAFVRPSGAGPLEEWEASVSGASRWTTDGRGLLRGRTATASAAGVLAASHLSFGCSATLTADRWDIREIAGSGVPLRMPGATGGSCELSTDSARSLSAALELYGEQSSGGPGLDRPLSYGTVLGVAARPHPRVETRLDLVLDRTVLPLRWVGDDGAGALLFARQDAPSLSVLLAQLWVLAPRLTLQLHGQLFTSYARYDRFRAARPAGGAGIDLTALAPVPAPAQRPDAHTTLLVVDAVLRWEVRPGATLFVVYARNQTGAPVAPGAAAPRTLEPLAAGRGPVVDAVLVKWSWWTGA